MRLALILFCRNGAIPILYVLLCGCVAGHQQFKTETVTRIEHCKHMHEAYKIAGVNCDQSKMISNGDSKSAFLVVELDDFGEFFDANQVEGAHRQIYEASNDGATVLLTYIHGWRHNASESSSNLRDFRKMVFDLADNPCAINGSSVVPDKNSHCEYKNVVGMYVGWRGDAFHPVVDEFNKNKVSWYLQSLTFWNRLTASKNVAGTNVTKFLLKAAQSLRAGDRDRVSSSCLYSDFSRASQRCSKNIIIGHSMGGRVLEQTVAQAFLGGRHTSDSADVKKLILSNIDELKSIQVLRESIDVQLEQLRNLSIKDAVERKKYTDSLQEHGQAVVQKREAIGLLRQAESGSDDTNQRQNSMLKNNVNTIKQHFRKTASDRLDELSSFFCTINNSILSQYGSPVYVSVADKYLHGLIQCEPIELLQYGDPIVNDLPEIWGDEFCRIISQFSSIFDEEVLEEEISEYVSDGPRHCDIEMIRQQVNTYQKSIDSLDLRALSVNTTGQMINFQRALADLESELQYLLMDIEGTYESRNKSSGRLREVFERYIYNIDEATNDRSILKIEEEVVGSDTRVNVVSRSMNLDDALRVVVSQRRLIDSASLEREKRKQELWNLEEEIFKANNKILASTHELEKIYIDTETAENKKQNLEKSILESEKRFNLLSTETELLYESVNSPPFDMALMLNPATSALNSRMLKNSMCDSIKLNESIGGENSYKRSPWLIAVSSVKDSATSDTFLKASQIENSMRVFKPKRNEVDGLRLGPFSTCAQHLPKLNQKIMDRKPAPFIEELHTHKITQSQAPYEDSDKAVKKKNENCTYNPDVAYFNSSDILAGIKHGANIAEAKSKSDGSCDFDEEYIGSYKGVDLNLYDLRKDKALQNDDYWILTVPEEIIPDHNSIFTYEVGLLASNLLNKTVPYGVYCRNSQADTPLCEILRTKMSLQISSNTQGYR